LALLPLNNVNVSVDFGGFVLFKRVGPHRVGNKNDLKFIQRVKILESEGTSLFTIILNQ